MQITKRFQNICDVPYNTSVNERQKNMGLKKSELAAIVGTSPDNCAITIKRTSDGFWFVTLTMLSSAIENELLTERGALKSWRDPAAAVQFVQEVCPDCRRVMLEINSWAFTRQMA